MRHPDSASKLSSRFWQHPDPCYHHDVSPPRTVLLAAIALLGVGCGYYDSSLLVPTSSNTAGAAGSPGSCQHAGPPDKPSVLDAGGDLELVFALNHIEFAPAADAGAVGYDIDRTCTCQGESDSCLVPSWATKQCDGPQGRDNTFGLFVQEVAGLMPAFGQNRWNTDLQNGAFGAVTRIRGYNGLPDDDQIEVSTFTAASYWTQHMLADGGQDHPKWDGTDTWPIFSSSLEPIPLADGGTTYDLDHPSAVDPKAYVSGGVAVGMLPSGVLQIDPSMRIVFTDMYMAARLVKTSTGWEMRDGTIAGVWTLQDMFKQIGYMQVAGMSLCKGNQVYDIFKKMICKYPDIYRSRGTPTTPCDSISIGLSYSAKQAQLGAIQPPIELPTPCPEGKDPSDDTCGP